MTAITQFHKINPSGPISRSILRAIEHVLADSAGQSSQHQALVRIVDAVPEACQQAKKRIDPVFALYQQATSLIAHLVGNLTHFDEFLPFIHLQQQAEQVFCFDGPPATPITESFSTTWTWFDAWLGPKRETRGTVILDVLRALDLRPDLIPLVENLVGSRMGIYLVTEVSGKMTFLRELVTGHAGCYHVPAGYHGKPGELWFVRLLPPPTGFAYGLALTTPYVLLHADSDDWEDYIQRAGKKLKVSKGTSRYEALMKYGLDRSYWFNFIEDAYIHNRKDVLFLGGTPDAPDGGPWAQQYGRMALADRMMEIAKAAARDRKPGQR